MPKARPAQPTVLVSSVLKNLLEVDPHDADFVRRLRVEAHIRRRLAMGGVHIIDHTSPYDAGHCGTSTPHADFELKIYPGPDGHPLAFLRRIQGKAPKGEPARWLLARDSDDVELIANKWAHENMGELPFRLVRWATLRELTDALRGVLHG